MKKIVLASGNVGKLREMTALLQPLGFTLLPQTELSVPTVAETGLSFVENALIKARHASEHTGLPAIADDSGLEVDVLAGQPGIYSARYAGEKASDQDNIKQLLQAVHSFPEQQLGARFQCVMVYLRYPKDPTPVICQGTLEGRITKTIRGEGGFGYDPIFYLSKLECTAAQLSAAEKNKISHRGQALRQLIEYFTKETNCRPD